MPYKSSYLQSQVLQKYFRQTFACLEGTYWLKAYKASAKLIGYTDVRTAQKLLSCSEFGTTSLKDKSISSRTCQFHVHFPYSYQRRRIQDICKFACKWSMQIKPSYRAPCNIQHYFELDQELKYSWPTKVFGWAYWSTWSSYMYWRVKSAIFCN